MSKVIANITTSAILKPNSVVVIHKFAAIKRNEKSNQNLLNISGKDGAYNGYLSENTTRQVKKVLHNWLTPMSEKVNLKEVPKEMNASVIYPTFVTLTLPSKQIHSDQKIKNECLDPFIEWLRTSCNVNCYFWRAETQKSGNLHFHLIIDRFIFWERLRKKWNMIIERLGYVTRYGNMQRYIHRNGYEPNKKSILQEIKRIEKAVEKFEESKNRQLPRRANARVLDLLKEKQRLGKKVTKKEIAEIAEAIDKDRYFNGEFDSWKNPNSTDIHAVNNINSLVSYVVKYVTKSPETPLLENQRIEKKDGKKVLFTSVTINNEIDEYTEEYKPTFDSRMVRGRLWGCSDSLRVKDEEQKQVLNYPTLFIMDCERVHDNDPKAVQEYYSRTTDFDKDSAEFIDHLKAQKGIDEREINNYCKVYASREPIKKHYDKNVMKIHKNHFDRIWSYLYGKTG